MDFRGLVCKRVWKITFFCLKQGQDLKNRAAHPHQEFPGVPAPPGVGSGSEIYLSETGSHQIQQTDVRYSFTEIFRL